MSTEEIFKAAVALPPEARVELAERLMESVAEELGPEISEAHLAEAKRRLDQVRAGEVELVPGDEVFERVKKLLANR